MRAIIISLALFAAALTIAGCSVQTKGKGDNADVKIETPFGGMKVKTNDAVSLTDIGLAAYPGATLVKKDTDSGSADVDMNFGRFHLRVKAANYRTPDSPDKVKAYYRKELAHYGDVIECKNDVAVGKPTKTREGLGCSDHDDHVNVGDNKTDTELRAGGKIHQHIVAIEKEGDGTNFGLVALDLPKDEKEKESN
jgi:hypothetical protein